MRCTCPPTERRIVWPMLLALSSCAAACSSASTDVTSADSGSTATVDGAPADATSEVMQPDAAPPCTATGASVDVISHDVVQKTDGVWIMGAANGGANDWIWDNEIVVSYARDRFEFRCGPGMSHNRVDGGDPAYWGNNWSRSMDGGLTWSHWNGPPVASGPSLPVDFTHPDFAMKLSMGDSNEDWEYYVTYDRWQTKIGPYTGLNDLKSSLPDTKLTTRTDYIVNGTGDIMLFMSARDDAGEWLDDFAFMARSQDGGQTFQYVSRINPNNDSARAVMPSAVRVSQDQLVVCLRRRARSSVSLPVPTDDAWIDCYRSDDNGQSWYFTDRADETGKNNGNPPALRRLPNGLLALVYGVRAWLPSSARMALKVSADNGTSWQLVGEKRIHDDYHVDTCGDTTDATDLGYPRLFLLPNGQLRAVYAWADGPNENHISSTLFEVNAICE